MFLKIFSRRTVAMVVQTSSHKTDASNISSTFHESLKKLCQNSFSSPALSFFFHFNCALPGLPTSAVLQKLDIGVAVCARAQLCGQDAFLRCRRGGTGRGRSPFDAQTIGQTARPRQATDRRRRGPRTAPQNALSAARLDSARRPENVTGIRRDRA
jgi:hypothetical protein